MQVWNEEILQLIYVLVNYGREAGPRGLRGVITISGRSVRCLLSASALYAVNSSASEAWE